jgi:hypothetical protein
MQAHMVLDQDKDLAGMDTLALLLVIHTDSQTHTIRMDTEVRHHQALEEEWVDLEEVIAKFLQ